jgi:hypothetical protein
MDMDECGMDAGYDPDEDECEQHEAPTGELTESQKERKHFFLNVLPDLNILFLFYGKKVNIYKLFL